MDDLSTSILIHHLGIRNPAHSSRELTTEMHLRGADCFTKLIPKIPYRLCLLLVLSFSLAPFAGNLETLPGTKPLTTEGDLSLKMIEQVDGFFLQMIDDSPTKRARLWSPDYSSQTAYAESVQPNRKRFARYIGVVEQRLGPRPLELVAALDRPSLVAETSQFRAYAVRWSVLEDVDAEGLLLEPRQRPKAQVIALPDADSTPEAITGLDKRLPAEAQFARRLAEAGCRVLVPTLIDRNYTWSGNPLVRMTNQTHREFIYRQAYFMGRHVIGYEVQKVLAAVDYFASRNQAGVDKKIPIGIAGYGEGGLVALHSAAVDERVTATLVSGYFQQREKVWQEPVYRNVWALLTEFGDAEIARLIAPRTLVIEANRGPEVGIPPPLNGQMYAASGVLARIPLSSVRVEFERAGESYRKLRVEGNIRLITNEQANSAPGSPLALRAFLAGLGIEDGLPPLARAVLQDQRGTFDAASRMKREFDQLATYTQRLMHLSPFRRAEFWAKADRSSVERWQETTAHYRDYLWDEVIGRLPPASVPPNPHTRLLYDTPKWKGYEVTLDVWPGVSSYGLLLMPKDLSPGEQRPVVVAQHGRAGRPQDVCDPVQDTRAYHSFGARLADRGFIVYAPQNLYLGEEKYRMLQRKANPLKLTFFAVMVRQHERTLQWLAGLPFVDAKRIGFYGLSYGGKSAMLIPAVLKGYALSICSGDFNETVWKHVSTTSQYSFMFTKEHEHTEFDFGDKFNYSDVAGLIAPRPFMVERGHDDGVASDEWVAYEYAKVRKLYVFLGIADRTEIEFFKGPHEIHGEGTFRFLHRHLNWPERSMNN